VAIVHDDDIQLVELEVRLHLYRMLSVEMTGNAQFRTLLLRMRWHPSCVKMKSAYLLRTAVNLSCIAARNAGGVDQYFVSGSLIQ
jgi:hypothetical protein